MTACDGVGACHWQLPAVIGNNIEVATLTRRYGRLVLAVTLIVAVIDQVVKTLVLANMSPGEKVPIVGDWFRFLLTFNSGAAFSMGENATWVFTTIQLVFIVAVFTYFLPRLTTNWTAIGVALIAGGALGNVIDRLFRAPGFFIGHVVDFISVGSFAIFNIADSAITVGVVIFIIGVLLEEQGAEEEKSGKSNKKSTGKAGTETTADATGEKVEEAAEELGQ